MHRLSYATLHFVDAVIIEKFEKNGHYKCNFDCDAFQKNFTNKDAFDLHMMYFHDNSQWLDNYIFTFNIEGFNRNKFYLTSLIRNLNPLLLFLQEHWLSHHEANNLSSEFSDYNFIHTSSDIFTVPEDIILTQGATWHGTALG